jgi:NhaP-type Na+/H+ or K+/H+ antiporter
LEVFQLILCIIGVVVFSSFASRFIPKVSTPLVQIAMGAIITQVPGFPNASLNPELFMVLFIAPLLYLEAHEIDKSELLKSLKASCHRGMWRSMSTVHLSTTKTHWLLRAAGLSSGTFQWCQALILPVQCPPAHILNIRPGIRSC